MEFHFGDSSSCHLYFHTTESKVMGALTLTAKPSHDLEKWAEYLSLTKKQGQVGGGRESGSYPKATLLIHSLHRPLASALSLR